MYFYYVEGETLVNLQMLASGSIKQESDGM
jgi:hypothetical protein